MLDRPSPDSALHRLQPGEICTIVLHDGTRRDAAWNPEDKLFRYCDGKGDGEANLGEVYEWWPAGVRF